MISFSTWALEIYEVKKDDTLMKISYKLYGNHLYWKQIKELNKDSIQEDLTLFEGQILKYVAKEKIVQDIPENAKPYLIKKGDTLQKISKKLYGTVKKFPELIELNPIALRDPESIYGGLLIYYIPKDSPQSDTVTK